jgi:hypothetical protein
VFLEGRSFLARELTRLGVGFRKDDSAFLAVEDLAALEAAAERWQPGDTVRLRSGQDRHARSSPVQRRS